MIKFNKDKLIKKLKYLELFFIILGAILPINPGFCSDIYKKYVADHRCKALLHEESLTATPKYPLLLDDQLFDNLASFPWIDNPELEGQLLALLSSEKEIFTMVIPQDWTNPPQIETLPLGYTAISKKRAETSSNIRKAGVDYVANEIVAKFLDRELGFNITPLTSFVNLPGAEGEPTKARIPSA